MYTVFKVAFILFLTILTFSIFTAVVLILSEILFLYSFPLTFSLSLRAYAS